MSEMTVGQIAEVVEREEHRVYAKLENVSIMGGGSEIKVKDDQEQEHRYPLDEVAERTLADFLSVNASYIGKCPPDLKEHNLNYWLRANEDVMATFMVGPKGLETIHDPDAPIVTVPEVAKVISRVFQPSDKIVTLFSDPTKFHADIVVDSNIEVPGNGLGDRPGEDGYLRRPNDPAHNEDGTPFIPPKVFDITHGGVRFLAHPTKAKAPVVQRYFNRLICLNGLTMPVVDQQITLKGNTVLEVLGEMEKVAEHLLSTMDEALEQYAELSNLSVPGNPLAVIRHIGKEQGIPDRIIAKALDYASANGLTEGRGVSSYDVMNIFTSLANAESVRYSTANKLQAVGGLMVHKGADMVHRCDRCAQLV